MAAAGSVTQVRQPNHNGPYPLTLWKALITVPAAATTVTVTSPNKLSGTVVAAWIDPGTLAAAATIKVYDATDAMTTPTYAVDYTVPDPAVESKAILNARCRVMGTLTCVVASAVAANSFDLYVFVDPNADTALPVTVASLPSHAVTNAGTFAVQVSSDVHPTGLSTVATGEQAGSVTAVQMATVSAKLVRLKALASNAGNVYVGTSNAVTKAAGTTDTTSGLELCPGDDTGFLPASNLNLFWIIADAATDDLSYMVMV